MAATAITTTTQDITGDFDLAISGIPTTAGTPIVVLKALGPGGTDWIPEKTLLGQGHHFIKNTGTNAYKLQATVTGITVKFNQ